MSTEETIVVGDLPVQPMLPFDIEVKGLQTTEAVMQDTIRQMVTQKWSWVCRSHGQGGSALLIAVPNC
jgi:hypothetical protein